MSNYSRVGNVIGSNPVVGEDQRAVGIGLPRRGSKVGDARNVGDDPIRSQVETSLFSAHMAIDMIIGLRGRK